MRLREGLLFILYSRILHSLYGTEKFTVKNLFIFNFAHRMCTRYLSIYFIFVSRIEMIMEKKLEEIDAYAIKVIDWFDGDSLLYLFCERMPESISCEANICPLAMQIPRGDIFATHECSRSMTKRCIFKKRSNVYLSNTFVVDRISAYYGSLIDN